jgi:uncharacterized protein (DUF1499 family)
VKTVGVILGLGLLALLGVAIWVRLAPSAPADWHVDPASVAERGPRNSFLVAPGGDAAPLFLPVPPEEAARRLDAIALATPRTTRLAGEGVFATYLTRSALFGFPDYTSVLVRPAPGGSELLVFARSRFGDGDMGVNRKRVEAWLAALSG